MPKYFLLYKPFDVLSQFSKEVPTHRTLADCYAFPKEVYPVGRLDRDSEGLLILTDDKKLNHRLLDPEFKHPRSYYVQVEGSPRQEQLREIRKGVEIKVNKRRHRTRPAKVLLLPSAPLLPERNPPIRFRKNIPTSWLSITLTEGKNRQVRKMFAKIGFPVLRLVRYQIGQLQMEEMESGKVVEWNRVEILTKLGLRE